MPRACGRDEALTHTSQLAEVLVGCRSSSGEGEAGGYGASMTGAHVQELSSDEDELSESDNPPVPMPSDEGMPPPPELSQLSAAPELAQVPNEAVRSRTSRPPGGMPPSPSGAEEAGSSQVPEFLQRLPAPPPGMLSAGPPAEDCPRWAKEVVQRRVTERKAQILSERAREEQGALPPPALLPPAPQPSALLPPAPPPVNAWNDLDDDLLYDDEEPFHDFRRARLSPRRRLEQQRRRRAPAQPRRLPGPRGGAPRPPG